MKSLIPTDQLIGEGESRHEASVRKNLWSTGGLLLAHWQTNRFLSQKMDANEPEKKMPSTAAKAMILSPKVAVCEAIHCKAQSAFLLTQGTSTHKKTTKHWLDDTALSLSTNGETGQQVPSLNKPLPANLSLYEWAFHIRILMYNLKTADFSFATDKKSDLRNVDNKVAKIANQMSTRTLWTLAFISQYTVAVPALMGWIAQVTG